LAILAARAAVLPADQIAEINAEHVTAEEARVERISTARKLRGAAERKQKKLAMLEKLQKRSGKRSSKFNPPATPPKKAKSGPKHCKKGSKASRFVLTPVMARFRPSHRASSF
jgi:hypothetical protein